MSQSIDNAFDQLMQGTAQVLPESGLRTLLEAQRPLRVKAGFDPTAADLHLGHTVLLNKLKTFQDLGHEVIFLIGDFTAMIGDPTGKNITRPMLTPEDIQRFSKTYQEQVSHFLDLDRVHIAYNHSWLSTLSAADLIRLSSHQTVARMLERDDFSKRYAQQQPIAIHEFLYPILQGYDSVHLKADIELGGNDQLFNLLMGRTLQAAHEQPPQVIMTLPLLEGLDGNKKMSKSQGNTIDIQGSPEDNFGRIMSISDDLMWRYLTILNILPCSRIDALKAEVKAGLNPRDVKLELAHACIARLHGVDSASAAQTAFIQRFSKQQLPDNIPEQILEVTEPVPVAQALKQLQLVQSTSEALRLIRQGAVRINEQRIDDNISLPLPSESLLIQVGKRRIVRLQLTPPPSVN